VKIARTELRRARLPLDPPIRQWTGNDWAPLSFDPVLIKLDAGGCGAMRSVTSHALCYDFRSKWTGELTTRTT
jgi:hypothetical protein